MVGKSQAAMFRGERPRETRLAPEWTLERMAATRSTSGSRPRTPAARQPRHARPRRQHRPHYSETNAEAKQRLYAKVKSILGKLDMNPDHLIHRFAYMKNDIPIAGCAHQAGRARSGRSGDVRARRELQAHELDNLYVVDTSVFPSIGAVNRR
jgi:choline dehydrogenase-like flavoprotein